MKSKTKEKQSKNKKIKKNKKNKTNKKRIEEYKGGKPDKKKKENPQKKEKEKQGIRVEWKALNCSPAVKGQTVSEKSCLVPKVLQKIKEEYNKDHPIEPITSNDPVQIWQMLHRVNRHCRNEMCWLNIIDESNERRRIQEI